MAKRSPEAVHKSMTAVKSTNTSPEMLLRKSLWHLGYRYRVNVKTIHGKPDIVFSKAKIAIFCDGDYWHGHNWAIRGMSSLKEELNGYNEYWKKKISRNVQRDIAVNEYLQQNGWYVIRLWESDIKKDIATCIKIISIAYQQRTNTSTEK